MRFKNYIFLSTAFFFVAFTGNRSGSVMPAMSSWEALNLHGKIKIMCQCDFNATAHGDVVSKTDQSPFSMDSTWFDDKGHKLKEATFSTNGKLVTEQDYKYDSAGNVVMSLETGKKINRKAEYKYDQDGNVSESKNYSNDSLKEDITYKYDNGHMTEEDVQTMYPVKKLTKHYYEYNADGDKTKENIYAMGSALYLAHTWTYDADHHVTAEETYNQKGLNGKIGRKYDRWGNMVEYVQYHTDGSIAQREVCTYNLKNKKTGDDWFDGNGNKTRYYTFSYDEKGNQTQYKQYNVYKDDTQMEVGDTYLFEYDKKENWVKKTDLKIDGTIVVTEREIMYY